MTNHDQQRELQQLRFENELLRRSHYVQHIASIINNLIKYGSLVFIFYLGYLSIVSISGLQTKFEIIADLKALALFVGAFLGVGGIVYGKSQEKLKKDTIQRLEGRVREKELSKDPKRTSSGLTTRGETNPEDL